MNLDRIDQARKSIMRAGEGFLKKIFEDQSEEGNVLSAKRSLKISDQMGLPIEQIIFMANSHGMTVDIEGFILLKESQQKPMRLKAIPNNTLA